MQDIVSFRRYFEMNAGMIAINDYNIPIYRFQAAELFAVSKCAMVSQ